MKYLITAVLVGTMLFITVTNAQPTTRKLFNDHWKFNLGDIQNGYDPALSDASWRSLDLPHDWSIELPFDKNSPTGTGGGALRGGIGWYRKSFVLPSSTRGKHISIIFDGVYRNSEVWVNGNYLGKRPNGYISFQYDLTPYLKYGNEENSIAVKVDNSLQPNSRWYSGSGIYRNVWLDITNTLHITYNGTYFTTPSVSEEQATVKGDITIACDRKRTGRITVSTSIVNAKGMIVASATNEALLKPGDTKTITQQFLLKDPILWSLERPYLYKAITIIRENGRLLDQYNTSLGIRYFVFDIDKGFLLNGKHVKIRGVCNHHDLGCLGTAVNKSAIARQLKLLKQMGCNGIRTSHNPPAPELLDLCDEMGFIVMDEAFDMWKKQKTEFDYHLDWDKWHRQDLIDQLVRDRNHPSVFIWSVGNEVMEQWGNENDSSGGILLKELVDIVHQTDPGRLTVTANNEVNTLSRVLAYNSADMIGYNYNHPKWDSVFARWGRKPFIVTESVSALMTRGHYDMPSDSIRRWPKRWDLPFTEGNPDTTCSAYDNCSTPWGTTHEETLKIFEQYDHISGMYIWTGFDYIGEPTPYQWPARSSYFGIIDLAGFPKDVYYMYQSVWTDKPILHIFPHWNWSVGDTVDVWAYYNNADEVELFLNGESLGSRRKSGDDLHVMWRVVYKPGVLKAVSRRNGSTVLSRQVKTAGPPAKIILETDKDRINKDEFSFITARIVDEEGNPVPTANNLIQFSTDKGAIVGVDNGSQTCLEPFKSTSHSAFNGLCLAVIAAKNEIGPVTIQANSPGLTSARITIMVQ